MPEIPDVENYREALDERLSGRTIRGIEVRNPFTLRTAEPAIESLVDGSIVASTRLGKRLVLEIDGERFLVIHLMIAGRLHWIPREPAKGRGRRAPGGKRVLLVLTSDDGALYLTEAGSKRRASVHVLAGRDALDAMDPGGLEVLQSSASDFRLRLRRDNHTFKRALTDPRILSGIGNAYSDEILHRACLGPMLQTGSADDDTLDRLFRAACEVLNEWTDRLRDERRAGDGFPTEVTAFRAGMAVHGRYGLPCPVCEAPVQRIVYSNRELDYCARCQTGGRILKDRALSRLLKDSFPTRLDD